MNTVEGLAFSAGDIVAGKYQVESVLGVGGMGYVVSAKHIQLDEYVALKFLHKDFLDRQGVPERFTREAKAACRIKSEHVARVYDVGTHEGAPFLVMEHLVGRDLATVLAEDGPLSVDSAVEFTMQTCAALAAAHSIGIIHRDIKPENLFLVEQQSLPTIKLLDFGISRVALTGVASGEVSRMTGMATLGTPLYMSPEQIRSSASADVRSNLWSLGIVLYELLAGAPAFEGEEVAEVFAAVLEQEPRPLRTVRPDVPAGLADVVERCLRKEPVRRYQNAAELAAALLPFAPPRALALAERSCSTLRAFTPISIARAAAKAPSDPSAVVTLNERGSSIPASSPAVVVSLSQPSQRVPSHPRVTQEPPPGRGHGWGRAMIVGLVAAVTAGSVSYGVHRNTLPFAVTAAAPQAPVVTGVVAPAPSAETPAPVAVPSAAEAKPPVVELAEEPKANENDVRPRKGNGAAVHTDKRGQKVRTGAPVSHAATPPPAAVAPTAETPVPTNNAPPTSPVLDLGY